MQMTLSLRMLLLFSLASLSITCWPSTVNAASRELRVASFPIKPLIYTDTDGATKGINADLLNQVARNNDWQLTYVEGSWNDGLQRARDKEVDLLTPVMYTEERDRYLDYTQKSYFTVWSAVYALPKSGIETILDLQNKTVAVMQGDQNGLNFKQLAQQFDLRCEYLELQNFDDVFKAVQQENAHAGVAVNIYGMLQAGNYHLVQTSIIFDPKPLYFAVPEGTNSDILKALDESLSSWSDSAGKWS